jgi:hypothetical protein
MNKTALQWLYDELAQCLHREEVCDLVYKLEQKALQMEREQIIDSFSEGTKMIDVNDELSARFNACVYYVETYGGDNE